MATVDQTSMSPGDKPRVLFTETPGPAPVVPPQVPTWETTILRYALLGAISLATYLFGASKPSPAPVPDPHGGGGQVIPAPPSPTPLPVNPVSLTDTSGADLGNTVKPGQLFIVSGPTDSVLTPVVDQPGLTDVYSVSDFKLVGTLQNGASLNLVVSGLGKPKIFAIKAMSTGPPTPPVPDDGKKNTPPVPKSRKLAIAVVEDASSRGPAVAVLYTSMGGNPKLAAKGLPFTWYDIPNAKQTIKEPMAQTAFDALTKAGVKITGSQAGYILYDQTTKEIVYAGPLISIDDAVNQATLNGGSV